MFAQCGEAESRAARCTWDSWSAIAFQTARNPPAGARKRYCSVEEKKMSRSPKNLRTIPVVCSWKSRAGRPFSCSSRPRSDALARALARAQWLMWPETPSCAETAGLAQSTKQQQAATGSDRQRQAAWNLLGGPRSPHLVKGNHGVYLAAQNLRQHHLLNLFRRPDCVHPVLQLRIVQRLDQRRRNAKHPRRPHELLLPRLAEAVRVARREAEQLHLLPPAAAEQRGAEEHRLVVGVRRHQQDAEHIQSAKGSSTVSCERRQRGTRSGMRGGSGARRAAGLGLDLGSARTACPGSASAGADGCAASRCRR